jgi:hypothetical protein
MDATAAVGQPWEALQVPSRVKPATLALVLALVLPACGGDGDEAAPGEQPPAESAATEAPEPITVELAEVNGSGQSGTATQVPRRVGAIDVYTVRIELGPAVESRQMAHVHSVTCAEYAALTDLDEQLATVQSPLADVVSGESETANISGAATAGGRSINVHEPNQPYPAVACGDIPQAGG